MSRIDDWEAKAKDRYRERERKAMTALGHKEISKARQKQLYQDRDPGFMEYLRQNLEESNAPWATHIQREDAQRFLAEIARSWEKD